MSFKDFLLFPFKRKISKINAIGFPKFLLFVFLMFLIVSVLMIASDILVKMIGSDSPFFPRNTIVNNQVNNINPNILSMFSYFGVWSLMLAFIYGFRLLFYKIIATDHFSFALCMELLYIVGLCFPMILYTGFIANTVKAIFTLLYLYNETYSMAFVMVPLLLTAFGFLLEIYIFKSILAECYKVSMGQAWIISLTPVFSAVFLVWMVAGVLIVSKLLV